MIHEFEIDCPVCGYEMDACVRADGGGRPPRTGDVSLCPRCNCPSVFCVHPTGRTHLRLALNRDEAVRVNSMMVELGGL